MPWSAEMKIRLVNELIIASFLALGWFCFEKRIFPDDLLIGPLPSQQFAHPPSSEPVIMAVWFGKRVEFIMSRINFPGRNVKRGDGKINL